MFRRNLETAKRPKGNENASEETASALKGNKQFGPSVANKSFIRNSNNKDSSSGLKLKSHNQKSEQLNKNTNEKQKLQVSSPKTNKPVERSNSALKRTGSAVGLIQHSQTKKQDIKAERTYRRKEQEQEWDPEGFSLDFSAFDDTVQESSYHFKNQLLEQDVNVDSFPAIERQFAVEAAIDVEQDIEQLEIEHDTSTVEYGPPKEQEIPYEPDQSCITDISNFTAFVDMDAYEYSRLSSKTNIHTLYQDPDALQQSMVYPIDDEALEFEYDSESYDQDSDLSNDLDFSSIPYSNHTFDVDAFIQCN